MLARAARWVPQRVRRVFDRKTIKDDATAGLVLGVESVPDGLASGLLAGVNPLAGLYAYLYGMVGAAVFTSSTFMVVNATGAMALIVADTDLASREDPEQALFTLAILTGVVMIVAGLLGAGALLRFVPTAVMTGFVTAVGINIILGQISGFTGYESDAGHRLLRAIDTLLHPGRIESLTLLVGMVTIVGILTLQRTRLKSLGMVVAVVVGSVLAQLLIPFGPDVATVADIAGIPNALPTPVLPSLGDLGFLILPAFSLAFVGLVQGAAVSAGIPSPDKRPADASRDFVGQGAGNIVAGLFRGMPVGGSMSGSGLVVAAGARTRLSVFIGGAVMAVVILVFADLVAEVAMPALAALLITVGAAAVKPSRIRSVVKTGSLQTSIMTVTFVLTILIPVQYAVLIGVGLAIIMYVAEQSNRLTLREVVLEPGGRMRETDPPADVPPGSVLVLQPYGSLFFASAPVLETQLPDVTSQTRGSVVILRLRGIDQLGLSLIRVLEQYAEKLAAADSGLKLVISNDDVRRQLDGEGVLEKIGPENVYLGSEWLGETVRRAYDDALGELLVVAAGEQVGDPGQDADHDRGDDGLHEAADLEVVADPGGEGEQDRVDHDAEQPEGDHGDRQ